MRFSAAAQLVILFSSASAAADKFHALTPLELACQRAEANLINFCSGGPVETDEFKRDWKEISTATIPMLNRVRASFRHCASMTDTLAPIARLVDIRYRYCVGKEDALKALLGSSYTPLFTTYMGARDAFIKAFIAPLLQIAGLDHKLPLLDKNADITKYLERVEKELASRGEHQVDKLTSLLSHIEAMTVGEEAVGRRDTALIDIANQIFETIHLGALLEELRGEIGGVHKADFKLRRLTFDQELALDTTTKKSINTIVGLASQYRHDLDAICTIIEAMISKMSGRGDEKRTPSGTRTRVEKREATGGVPSCDKRVLLSVGVLLVLASLVYPVLGPVIENGGDLFSHIS